MTKIKNYASRSITRHCRRCNKTASLLMECFKIAYTTVFRTEWLGVLKNHPRFSKLLSQAHTLHIHRPPCIIPNTPTAMAEIKIDQLRPAFVFLAAKGKSHLGSPRSSTSTARPSTEPSSASRRRAATGIGRRALTKRGSVTHRR